MQVKYKLFFFISLILTLFILQANNSKGFAYWMDNIYSSCDRARCTDPYPGTCSTTTAGVWNSSCSANNDCAQPGSQAWTKYDTECKLVDQINNVCQWAWVPTGPVGSTGDKCIGYPSGPYNPYSSLNAGSC